MYSRDPFPVLIEEMATEMSEDVVMEHRVAVRISHPLNAKTVTNACKAVKREVKLLFLEQIP